jgi:hypothetical protein
MPGEGSSSTQRYYMLLSNAAMTIGWIRVLLLVGNNFRRLQDPNDDFCETRLEPVTKQALAISFLELLNALAGVTRSKPHMVLLFTGARTSVEWFIVPLVILQAATSSCSNPYHLFTVACWALGDSIRFGCFTLDTLMPEGGLAKAIRYTVGPLVFPLGITGETILVYQAARATGHPFLVLATILWPVAGVMLVLQLLKQRRRFFAKQKSETSPSSVQAKVKAV